MHIVEHGVVAPVYVGYVPEYVEAHPLVAVFLGEAVYLPGKRLSFGTVAEVEYGI